MPHDPSLSPRHLRPSNEWCFIQSRHHMRACGVERKCVLLLPWQHRSSSVASDEIPVKRPAVAWLTFSLFPSFWYSMSEFVTLVMRWSVPPSILDLASAEETFNNASFLSASVDQCTHNRVFYGLLIERSLDWTLNLGSRQVSPIAFAIFFFKYLVLSL
jgi:hypothetical protein